MTLPQFIALSQMKKRIKPADLNRNGQIVIRDTGLPGTDYQQRVYQIGCSECGYVYGANGSDVHERKCPKCQGGKPGLPYE